MEPNNTQHKSFLWHLDFEPFTWHTFYGEQCPPFVTEENKEAWRRYSSARVLASSAEPLDKLSCTRQFESELSLRSFA